MTDPIEPIFICQPEEVELMAEAAERYLARGDFASMESVLYGIAQVEPNTPWVFSSLGYAQHQLGKLDDAEQSYRRAIALSEPPEPMASVNLIGVFLAQQRVDEAIDQLAKVIESGDRSEPVAIAVARFAHMLADHGIGVDEAAPAKKKTAGKKQTKGRPVAAKKQSTRARPVAAKKKNAKARPATTKKKAGKARPTVTRSKSRARRP